MNLVVYLKPISAEKRLRKCHFVLDNKVDSEWKCSVCFRNVREVELESKVSSLPNKVRSSLTIEKRKQKRGKSIGFYKK